MADLTVTAKLVGPTIMAARIRDHVVLADIPAAMGGTDIAPLPPEIFLASLAQCFGMVAALHCRSREIPCQGLEVTVTADKAKDDDGSEYWTNIKMHARIPGDLDRQRLEAMGRHAKLLCSVRGTIIRDQEIDVTIE